MVEREQELADRQRNAASSIIAKAQTLGQTTDLPTAQRLRDEVIDLAGECAEHCGTRARIRERDA